MFKGFKNFLMQGSVVTIAVGLVVALAFSTLVKALTDNVITPLVNAAANSGKHGAGLGWILRGQHIDLGAFVSAVVYFVVFMATVYFTIVVPYRAYMRRRGTTVFAEAPPTKTCPRCCSDDLALEATRCPHCAVDIEPEGARAA